MGLMVQHSRRNVDRKRVASELEHADENLLRTERLALFPNLKTVEIYSNSNSLLSAGTFCFDLFLFLEAIGNASETITYTIWDRGNWNKDAFADSSLTKAYKEKGWHISYKSG